MTAMSKTIAIVQARLGSSRLRNKASRRLGGRSLLEHVVRRVTDCAWLDGVVVAAGDSREDREIASLAPPEVPVFYGDGGDLLRCFVDTIDAFDADHIVRVCPDNPFIDPLFIERLVLTGREHPHCDYIGYASRTGRPAVLSSVGIFGEWCKADALRTAAREARSPADREQVTRYIYSHPETFRLRLIPIPDDLDRDDLRLTVDYEEDFEHAQWIFEALGAEESDWRRIAGLLKEQPKLRERMARLNREHARA